jgi:hypothetical protein
MHPRHPPNPVLARTPAYSCNAATNHSVGSFNTRGGAGQGVFMRPQLGAFKQGKRGGRARGGPGSRGCNSALGSAQGGCAAGTLLEQWRQTDNGRQERGAADSSPHAVPRESGAPVAGARRNAQLAAGPCRARLRDQRGRTERDGDAGGSGPPQFQGRQGAAAMHQQACGLLAWRDGAAAHCGATGRIGRGKVANNVSGRRRRGGPRPPGPRGERRACAAPAGARAPAAPQVRGCGAASLHPCW